MLKRVASIVLLVVLASAWSCPPRVDPRNTCGPKVPLEDCIK